MWPVPAVARAKERAEGGNIRMRAGEKRCRDGLVGGARVFTEGHYYGLLHGGGLVTAAGGAW